MSEPRPAPVAPPYRVSEVGLPPTFEPPPSEDRDVSVMNMGPHHPSTHGVLRLILTLQGERVLDAVPDIGFLHTGIEKTAEVKTWFQAVTLTDRMDYLSPLSNNLGYTLAVEALLGIRVPERVEHIRVLLCELQRVASHLVWLGTSGLDTGASSMFMYCFEDRERILDLFEMASGVRMMTSYITPGGLLADLPDGWLEKARAVVAGVPPHLEMYHNLLTGNEIWRERTRGIGVLTRQQALDWAVTGPCARASGVDWDLRRDMPYSGYETYDFKVPVYPGGDCFDRYRVRMDELDQSVSLCRQALDRIEPKGPFRVDDRKVSPPPRYEISRSMESLIHHFKLFTEGFSPPPGEVMVRIEAPKGELGFYLVSDGTNKPYRMHARTPSFANVQMLPLLLRGGSVADAVVSIASVDFTLGDVDR